MCCYSKKSINIITLIITLLIFIQVNYITIKIISFIQIQNYNKQTIQVEKSQTSEVNVQNKVEKEENWNLVIPKLNINATIKEGTGQEVLKDYVGHFTATPKLEGNIGLIGNNSGGNNNYFENLENLEENDVILYQYNNSIKQYKVIQNIIIQDTDWTYLRNEEENKITLITGAKTNKNERRCVQAIQI